MKQLRVVAMLAVAAAMPLAGGPAARGGELWDNGDWDTQIPIPHRSGQGQRRSVLDDFVIEDAAAWSVTSLTAVFVTRDVRLGTDLEAVFYADRGGRPDFEALVASAQNRVYRETWLFGGCFGCLDVWEAEATFDEIILPAGRYWVDMHLVGPDPFQVTTYGVIGSAMWVDYEDLGGRRPGKKLFLAEYDVNFKLYGDEIIPAPGAVVLLAGATLARRRRRGNR